jgi:hypothetical protein
LTGQILLVLHIAILGYWLGSELVINSTYRFICFRDDLPFAARDALTDHLMDVDQHVRYALILQLTLGVMLMAQAELVASELFWIALILGAAWLLLVEVVHRMRKCDMGRKLAAFDRGLRYVVLAGLLGFAIFAELPLWLKLKLAAFAGVMACGVAIRFWLIRHFRVWGDMVRLGPTERGNAIIKRTYWQATATLGFLWLFIALATILAIWKI